MPSSPREASATTASLSPSRNVAATTDKPSRRRLMLHRCYWRRLGATATVAAPPELHAASVIQNLPAVVGKLSAVTGVFTHRCRLKLWSELLPGRFGVAVASFCDFSK
ncbi:hypothetical protein AHAS_Ahas02G0077900 [Arachis hypogaea]